MRKITPFLWFDHQAEEAAQLYTAIFKNSKINSINRSEAAEPGAEGAVMSVSFELEGLEFIALNGGPHFTFTPAISLFVSCETQDEVDILWGKLCEGGEEGQCGWLKDKFGLSWQIIPKGLVEMLYSKDAQKSRRAMDAMLLMKKIDIARIKQAYEQE
jgi:predicted 3-demethylubiquinone-9 3-methyltransferase (glyoxalase superfamily)